mgnify:CR=1 FL=1
MKLVSCSITASYKGCWIHQHTDGSFSWQSTDLTSHRANSWRAAQIAITRHVNRLV